MSHEGDHRTIERLDNGHSHSGSGGGGVVGGTRGNNTLDVEGLGVRGYCLRVSHITEPRLH